MFRAEREVVKPNDRMLARCTELLFGDEAKTEALRQVQAIVEECQGTLATLRVNYSGNSQTIDPHERVPSNCYPDCLETSQNRWEKTEERLVAACVSYSSPNPTSPFIGVSVSARYPNREENLIFLTTHQQLVVNEVYCEHEITFSEDLSISNESGHIERWHEPIRVDELLEPERLAEYNLAGAQTAQLALAWSKSLTGEHVIVTAHTSNAADPPKITHIGTIYVRNVEGVQALAIDPRTPLNTDAGLKYVLDGLSYIFAHRGTFKVVPYSSDPNIANDQFRPTITEIEFL